jgi:hypothetical protein
MELPRRGALPGGRRLFHFPQMILVLTNEPTIILESAVAGFEQRFLTTDLTDFNGFYGGNMDWFRPNSFHRMGEMRFFHNSFIIRKIRVIRGFNC